MSRKNRTRKPSQRQAQERGDKMRALSLRYAGSTPKLKPTRPPEPEPPKGSYAAYITSAEWRMRKIEILAQRGAKCERCGSFRRLQVHHRSYARLGRELPEDLEILCNGCHEAEHGLAPKQPSGTSSTLLMGRTKRLNLTT